MQQAPRLHSDLDISGIAPHGPHGSHAAAAAAAA